MLVLNTQAERLVPAYKGTQRDMFSFEGNRLKPIFGPRSVLSLQSSRFARKNRLTLQQHMSPYLSLRGEGKNRGTERAPELLQGSPSMSAPPLQSIKSILNTTKISSHHGRGKRGEGGRAKGDGKLEEV